MARQCEGCSNCRFFTEMSRVEASIQRNKANLQTAQQNAETVVSLARGSGCKKVALLEVRSRAISNLA